MLVADAGIGLVNALGGTAITFGETLEQAACTVPAVWLLVGLATAVIATRPTLRPLGGAGIVATFGITLLGPTFRFPDQAMSISPIGTRAEHHRGRRPVDRAPRRRRHRDGPCSQSASSVSSDATCDETPGRRDGRRPGG